VSSSFDFGAEFTGSFAQYAIILKSITAIDIFGFLGV